MRMRILASPERLEGLAPLSEGVDEQRIGLTGLAVMADRPQVAPPAQLGVPCGTCGRPSTTVLTMLDEAAVQNLYQRDIEPIEPDHRLVRLISVVVPQQRGRQDQIVSVHVGALPI